MTGNKRSIIVQERERHLLRELAIMRVIDREQVKCVAGFRSTTRANTRLLALTKAGFLRRFFLGTVGGARKSIYAASQQGAKLVGVPYRGPRRERDATLAADFFTEHQLRINGLYCLLKYRQIPVEGVTFLRWHAFFDEIAPGVSLIPDGYVELAVPGRILSLFIEVDLGHESRSVWQRKVQAYLRYATSGQFTEHFKAQQFRTLAIVNSDRRLTSLVAATAPLTEKIFWFTTFEEIERKGFWSAIWRRPATNQPQPLLQLP